MYTQHTSLTSTCVNGFLDIGYMSTVKMICGDISIQIYLTMICVLRACVRACAFVYVLLSIMALHVIVYVFFYRFILTYSVWIADIHLHCECASTTLRQYTVYGSPQIRQQKWPSVFELIHLDRIYTERSTGIARQI